MSSETALLSLISAPMKSPTKRIFEDDHYWYFLASVTIEFLESLNKADCPLDYLFSKHKD